MKYLLLLALLGCSSPTEPGLKIPCTKKLILADTYGDSAWTFKSPYKGVACKRE